MGILCLFSERRVMSLTPIPTILQDCVTTLLVCIQDGHGPTTFVHGGSPHALTCMAERRTIVGPVDYEAMMIDRVCESMTKNICQRSGATELLTEDIHAMLGYS
jgi:hypothetical protein